MSDHIISAHFLRQLPCSPAPISLLHTLQLTGSRRVARILSAILSISLTVDSSVYFWQARLAALVRRLKLAEVRAEADAEFDGDVPTEFRDIIMDSIMLDPVRLPASRQIIDRGCVILYCTTTVRCRGHGLRVFAALLPSHYSTRSATLSIVLF